MVMRMSATAFPLDVESLIADSSKATLASLLADDVRWVEVDQRSQPHAPAIYRGRAAVLAMLEETAARGITSQVVDGFSAGDRAALAVLCSYPGGGGEVRCNALLHVRDGKIVRWDGVQAWDE
jgi:ketosteroid isomerase-like protein